MDKPTDETAQRDDPSATRHAVHAVMPPSRHPADPAEHRPTPEQIEQLALLGQAVATVTHELRNPLASMRTWLHVLEQKLPPESADLTRPIDRLKKGVMRCDTIIDDLLDFARERKLEPESTHVDVWLKALINDQPLPDNLTVDFVPGLKDRRMAVDRERLRRAIVNLIGNAVESVKEAGWPGKISIATREAAGNIEILVTDNGPGVTAELRERIFQPLFSTRGAGLGLGLAVVSRIAAQHGGSVRLEDPPEGGACFVIALPKA